eukprot:1618493-Pleurochrysis_carterae.AAC.3
MTCWPDFQGQVYTHSSRKGLFVPKHVTEGRRSEGTGMQGCTHEDVANCLDALNATHSQSLTGIGHATTRHSQSARTCRRGRSSPAAPVLAWTTFEARAQSRAPLARSS